MSFTFFTIPTVEAAIKCMGFSPAAFQKMPRGAMGYKCMHKNSDGLSILSEGNADMGIHVSVPGSAVAGLLGHFRETRAINTPFGRGYDIDIDSTALAEFLAMVKANGSFSRLDLAIDDIGAGYFSVDDVENILKGKRLVTKFRSYSIQEESKLTGERTGHTIYLGKRVSEIFMRIYDKKLKQGKKSPAPMPEGGWVRWEMELKGGRANGAAQEIISRKGLGEICVGILANYVRVINLDNANRSRCSMDSMWGKFIAGLAPLRLFVKKTQRVLDDVRRWINRQVLPSIATIILADGGSLDFFERGLQAGRARMRRNHWDMVLKENPGAACG